VSDFATTSPDGTRICASQSGSGPPLVVVHGIAADAGRFAGDAPPRLDEHFTVFAMDRRGRGASGDAEAYTYAREVEDLVAMIDAVSAEAGHARIFVLGHSFGGLVALDALPRTTRIAKLVVYEPYSPEVPVSEPSAITRAYMAMADAGEHEALVVKFLREIVRMRDEDVARLRAHPSWAARLRAAPTIAREMAAAETHTFTPARYEGNAVPIRMLLGGASPAFLREATARLHAHLPASEIFELAGQQHIAMDTAPAMFLDALRAFLV
jgi:pimeloyl-ACP methyl ester carboxylesterase